MRTELEFSIEGDTAIFVTDEFKYRNRSWRMNIPEVAVIAVEFDNTPDFGYTESIIFIDKGNNFYTVYIEKIKYPIQFDVFWKEVSKRLGIDLDYRRESFPDKTLVVYPEELSGENLFEPWTLISWPKIIIHFITHIASWRKRLLNSKVIQYIDALKG